MSHAATNWAIQQRGLKPAAKIVLWHLCDRHHPDNGCFPRQDTLAADCEISRAGLNNQLNALARAGLISRDAKRDGAGRQLVTRYHFAFEQGFEREPCPETGHGSRVQKTAKAVSKKRGKPCPEFGHIENTVKEEPVREPLSARAREAAKPAEREGLEELQAIIRAWPTGAYDSKAQAQRAWAALSGDEKRSARDELARYVAHQSASGRKWFCTVGTYLAEKRWEALPASVARLVAARVLERKEPPKPLKPTAFHERLERERSMAAVLS